MERQCRQMGIALLDLSPELVNPEVAGRVDLEMARQFRLVPISEEQGQVTVAMADPTDARLVERLAAIMHCSVFPVYSSPTAIDSVLDSLRETQIASIAF